MGEEYGERAPFLFFTDFGDPALQAAVSRGRREEFAAFGWAGEVADPQDPATFTRSKLNWNLRAGYPHRWLLEYYQSLLALRRQHPVLGVDRKRGLQIQEPDDHTLVVFRRGADGSAAFGVLHFSPEGRTVRLRLPPGPWRRLVDSAEDGSVDFGAKSPASLPVLRGGWIEIDIAGHAALIYLRGAVATARCRRRSPRAWLPKPLYPAPRDRVSPYGTRSVPCSGTSLHHLGRRARHGNPVGRRVLWRSSSPAS